MPTGVYVRTKETRIKMSLAHTGKKSPHTREQNKKISEALKGNKNCVGKKNTFGKHWKLSEETKKKQGEAKKGQKRTQETIAKWREKMVGRKYSKEHRRKISESMVGMIFSTEHRRNIGKAHSGERSCNWKGEKVGYSQLHRWKRNQDGNPTYCNHCGAEGKYMLQIRNGKIVQVWNTQWANKSGEYRRELNDWIGLCQPCHGEYDSKLVES